MRLRNIDFSLKRAGFASAGILAAGIMGCAHKQPLVIAPVEPIIPPLEYQCGDSINRSGAGSGIAVGLSPRASYRIRLNTLGMEDIGADITVPIILSDGNAVVTMGLRFDDVSISRKSLVSVIEEVCSAIENRGMARPLTAQYVQADYRPVEDSVRIPDLSDLLKAMLNYGAFNKALANIAMARTGTISSGNQAAQFSVSASNGRFITLIINSGIFAGQTYNLDRQMDFGVDFVGSPDHLFIPMVIAEVATAGARYSIFLTNDCGRELDLVLGETVYRGPNAACR